MNFVLGLLSNISGKAWKYIIFVVGILSTILYIFRKGQQSQRNAERVSNLQKEVVKQQEEINTQRKTSETKIKHLETYKETREKIDETPINTNRSDAINRLRRNNFIRTKKD